MPEFPGSEQRWRCARCGNLTRFDVKRSVTAAEYWHADLAGELKLEEQTVISEVIESVTCRWCSAGSDEIAVVSRVDT